SAGLGRITLLPTRKPRYSSFKVGVLTPRYADACATTPDVPRRYAIEIRGLNAAADGFAVVSGDADCQASMRAPAARVSPSWGTMVARAKPDARCWFASAVEESSLVPFVKFDWAMLPRTTRPSAPTSSV